MKIAYIAHPIGGDVAGNIKKILAIVLLRHNRFQAGPIYLHHGHKILLKDKLIPEFEAFERCTGQSVKQVTTSPVKCEICEHEWEATRTDAASLIECPNCSNETHIRRPGEL